MPLLKLLQFPCIRHSIQERDHERRLRICLWSLWRCNDTATRSLSIRPHKERASSRLQKQPRHLFIKASTAIGLPIEYRLFSTILALSVAPAFGSSDSQLHTTTASYTRNLFSFSWKEGWLDGLRQNQNFSGKRSSLLSLLCVDEFCLLFILKSLRFSEFPYTIR